jgi:capsule biosynthesis phosphatase
MRVCIDLDGVICELRAKDERYEDLRPVEGAVAAVQSLKAAGHTIILHTARHMKTCEGNVGLVLARQGRATFEWLARHDVPFDEIHFGKPQADVYIDDNALRFSAWSEIAADGSNLPISHEERRKG